MTDSYEKIKIAIGGETLRLLDRDAEAFEFRKKDGSLNRNHFINSLIVHYFEAFSRKEKEEKENLMAIAKSCHLEEEKARDFIDLLLRKKTAERKAMPLSESLSFRPTKESIYAIDYIQENLLEGSTLSEYFRRLFTRYASLPQFQRERVLFRETYEEALKAISEGKKIYVCTRNNVGNRTPVQPYSWAVVKEETYNYLLIKNGEAYQSFRLSKIVSLRLLDSPSSFDDKDKERFERMKKYGPQYHYEDEPVQTEIVLTPKGERFFKAFYVYRPIPDKVEGNHYFFSCSLDQLGQYFARFGAECTVLSPKRLATYLLSYYGRAYRKFRGIDKEN